MNRQDGIHVAVVGLGFGAEFVPIYLHHPDVAAVTVCDLDQGWLEQVRSKYPVTAWCTDFDQIVGSSEIDAVHLVSGIPEHARQAVAALQAGKHCACTVPMATSLADLRAVVDAQRQSGRNYMLMETAVRRLMVGTCQQARSDASVLRRHYRIWSAGATGWACRYALRHPRRVAVAGAGGHTGHAGTLLRFGSDARGAAHPV
jgi:hypothetical protein